MVSLALTTVLATLMIAIAWFFYRPLVAIVALAAGIALAFGFRTLAARRSAARTARLLPRTMVAAGVART